MSPYYAQACVLEWKTMLSIEAFIFRTSEMYDFMKQLPSHCLITAPAQFSKMLGHYGCTIHHASEPVAFLRSGREKDNFLPIR